MNGIGLGLASALALVAAAATAEPPLQLHQLPLHATQATAPIPPDWVGQALPAAATTLAGGGWVATVAAPELVELGMFRGHGHEDADRSVADEVLVLSGGNLGLADLSRAAGDSGSVTRQGSVFTLHRRLLIRGDAGLTIGAGETLRLDGRAGAFVVNAGRLSATGSQITSWDEATGRPMPLRHDQSFRPFIAAIAGSWTELRRTTLAHLGYAASKAYGLTLTSGPTAVTTLPPPSGRLIGNAVIGNYYGFYSHEAEDVVIAANLFRDSIVYGIDPHDRSRRLLIADNVVTGTRRKHGIVLSREVTDSWLVGNWSIDNAGSGITLDRSSSGNVIAGNLTRGNGGDGISVMESPGNRLWHNLAIANGSNGLRIRNSWDVEALHNRWLDNDAFGIEVYAKDLHQQPGRDLARDPYQARVGVGLGANLIEGNGAAAIALRGPGWLDLWAVAQTRQGPRALDLGGDLAAQAEPIRAWLGEHDRVHVTVTGPPDRADRGRRRLADH